MKSPSVEIAATRERKDLSHRTRELIRISRRTEIAHFRWLGQRRRGSHEPLIIHETFDRVQGVLTRKPCIRSPKQRHAFMGLLTCARCGCAMTAEKKKGKYIYYRCTGFKGACGNTYVREERLADLLGGTIAPIQITAEIAAGIAEALQTGEGEVLQRR